MFRISKKRLINHWGPGDVSGLGGEAQKTEENWREAMKSSPRRAGESICDGEKTRILEGKKGGKKVSAGRKRREEVEVKRVGA